MSAGEGGGGHFADTGGYGSFNQGGGGFQSGGSLSGGRGEYGLAGDRSFNSGNVGSYSDKSAGGAGPSIGTLWQQAMKKRQIAAKKAAVKKAAIGEKIIAIEPYSTKSIFDRIPPTQASTATRGWSAYGDPTANWGDSVDYGGGFFDPENNWGYDADNRAFGGNYGNFAGGGMAGRALGGPVAPGRSYTVGENGPETLQMGPGGGGQVIPHNPMDRARGPMGGGILQQFQPRDPAAAITPTDDRWSQYTPEQLAQRAGPGQPATQPSTYPPAPGTPPPPGGPGQPPLGGMRHDQMQAFHQLMQQWRQSRPDMQGLQGDARRTAIQDWRGLRPDRPTFGQQPRPPRPLRPDRPMMPRPSLLGRPAAATADGWGMGGNALRMPGIASRFGVAT